MGVFQRALSQRLNRLITIIFVPILAALLPLILPPGRNFEYEYATLNAYACLLLIPFSALIGSAQRLSYKRIPLLLLGILGNILPGFLAFPLNLCPCAQGEFFTFWLVQTLPHLLLGLGVASWFENQRAHGEPRIRLLLISGLILFGSCLYLATHIWFEPQKRATHIFAGFLHGAIYDSWIPLDPGIILARSGHAAVGLALLAAFLLRPLRVRWPVTALALLAAIGLLWKAGDYPSQDHGLASLIEVMPDSRVGPGFTLHYKNRPLDGDFQKRLETIYQSSLFHTQDLMILLDVPNPGVHIFIYPDRESKKLWFGGDGTDITDVVTPSIHLTLDSWPHPTLRHELVHAVASRFAYHGLGFHPNMAITEGLAVALAPTEDVMSLHEGAADIIQNRRVENLERLFSPLFWSESGHRAYTVAGSLILYLLQQPQGLDKVKELYAGGTWDGPTVIREWQAFLQQNYARPPADLQAEALFRYPGILNDLCPHSKAQLSKAGPGFLLNWRRPGDWQVGRDYWPWRVQLDQNPGAAITLLQQRFRAAGETDPDLDRDIEAAAVRPPKLLEHVEAFLLLSDRLVQKAEDPKAEEDLKAFLASVKGIRIGDELLRQLWVRWLLLRDVPIEQRRPWQKLLAGLERQIPDTLRPEASWIETYLFLRNARPSQIPDELLDRMKGQALPDELPDTFRLEWWKILGSGYLQKGDLKNSIAMYTKAAAMAPEGSRASLKMLVEELKFRKEPQSRSN